MRRIPLFLQERDASAAERRSLGLELIAVLLSYLCLMLGQSALSLLLSAVALPFSGVLSLFGAAFAALPIYLLCFRIGRLRAEDLYLKDKKAVRRLSFGLFWGICMLVLLIGVLLLCGGYVLSGKRLDNVPYLPLLLFAFLLQGSAEELLCRGLVMSAFAVRYGGTAGAFGSALFFMVLHALNPGVTALGLLNVFLFGLLFSAITQKCGSILVACGLHAGWNFALSLFGVQISGNAPPHSVFLLESRLPLLSGGTFGPEGSPLLTVFLLALLLISLIFSKKYKNGTK